MASPNQKHVRLSLDLRVHSIVAQSEPESVAERDCHCSILEHVAVASPKSESLSVARTRSQI
eukprot:1589686-Rhodomonas_salina.1